MTSPLTNNVWSLLESDWRTTEPLRTTTYKRDPPCNLSSIREVACISSSKGAGMRQLWAPKTHGLTSWSSLPNGRREESFADELGDIEKSEETEGSEGEEGTKDYKWLRMSHNWVLGSWVRIFRKASMFWGKTVEFKEPRPPSKCQRAEWPSQTLWSADRGDRGTPPLVLLL